MASSGDGRGARVWQKTASLNCVLSLERLDVHDPISPPYFSTPSPATPGTAGLYDYGPTGCAIMNNIQQEWRRHFVLEDNVLEINCPAMTQARVLE